jgi:hypothetical protein
MFKELMAIQELRQFRDPLVTSQDLAYVSYKRQEYPLISFEIGSSDPKAPTLGIFAGVHGLERVGTHVAIAFLSNLIHRLSWDETLREDFKNFRVVSIPMINPAGMDHFRRSNPSGVDLMRNAPVQSKEAMPWLGGHRLSPLLPWYRGEESSALEVESQTVIDYAKKNLLLATVAMSIDIHSGFGLKDRLWYPWAKSRTDFPYKKKVMKIKDILDHTLPYHVYQIEPQSMAYTTHGDLWDYLLEKHFENNLSNLYIPWTLELGSWMWVKKNPLQIFSLMGLFNPVKQHRFNRIMRRHLLLLDFLKQMVRNSRSWSAP